MYKQFFDKKRDDEMKDFLLQLSQLGSTRVYYKGEHITPSNSCVYIIQRGKVSRLYSSKDGKEKILYFLSPGDLIGERQYFDGAHDSSILLATTETHISVFHDELFEKLLNEQPIIYRYLLSSIIRKSRILESQVVSASFGDSLGRVADVLLRFFYQNRMYEPNATKILPRKHTHDEIAKILGCSRVTVTKCLNTLEKEGVVEIKSDTIIINNSDGLRQHITWL